MSEDRDKLRDELIAVLRALKAFNDERNPDDTSTETRLLNVELTMRALVISVVSLQADFLSRIDAADEADWWKGDDHDSSD